MDRLCIMHAKNKKYIQIVRKPKGSSPFGRPRCVWVDMEVVCKK